MDIYSRQNLFFLYFAPSGNLVCQKKKPYATFIQYLLHTAIFLLTAIPNFRYLPPVITAVKRGKYFFNP